MLVKNQKLNNHQYRHIINLKLISHYMSLQRIDYKFITSYIIKWYKNGAMGIWNITLNSNLPLSYRITNHDWNESFYL